MDTRRIHTARLPTIAKILEAVADRVRREDPTPTDEAKLMNLVSIRTAAAEIGKEATDRENTYVQEATEKVKRLSNLRDGKPKEEQIPPYMRRRW